MKSQMISFGLVKVFEETYPKVYLVKIPLSHLYNISFFTKTERRMKG